MSVFLLLRLLSSYGQNVLTAFGFAIAISNSLHVPPRPAVFGLAKYTAMPSNSR